MPRQALLLVAAGVVAIGLVPAVGPTTAAVAATLPVVSDVRILGDRTPTLTKDEYAVVTVQARFACDASAGCRPWSEEDQLYFTPFVETRTLTPGTYPPLYRVVNFDDNGQAPLAHFRRVTGESDGMYRASLVFSAMQKGSHRIDAICLSGTRIYSFASTSASTRTITVTGSDPVILPARISPGAANVKPWPSYLPGKTTLSYLVQTRDSGHARAGRTVLIADPDGYGDLGEQTDYRTVTTAANGFTPTVNGFGLQRFGANHAEYVRTLNVDGVDEVMSMAVEPTFPTPQSKPSRTSVSIKASTSAPKHGRIYTLSGTVKGNGTPARPDTVLVQRWVSGKWTTLGRTVLLASGRWTYPTKPGTKGTYTYRVVKPTNSCVKNLCMSPQAVSPTLKVKVS